MVKYPLYDTGKAQGDATFRFVGTIKLFPFDNVLFQYVVQASWGVIFADIQVEVKDRTYCPILFQLLYGQALEQFALSQKIGFEGRYQQAFAEAARAAQEIITAVVTNRCTHAVLST